MYVSCVIRVLNMFELVFYKRWIILWLSVDASCCMRWTLEIVSMLRWNVDVLCLQVVLTWKYRLVMSLIMFNYSVEWLMCCEACCIMICNCMADSKCNYDAICRMINSIYWLSLVGDVHVFMIVALRRFGWTCTEIVRWTWIEFWTV